MFDTASPCNDDAPLNNGANVIKMLNKFIVLLAIFAFSTSAFSATYTGKLIGGGGIDDLSLTIQTQQGKYVDGYCQTVSICDDWERMFKSDDDGIYSLKPEYQHKKVRVTIVQRPNRGRIAGPSDDEVLPFITQFKFLN